MSKSKNNLKAELSKESEQIQRSLNSVVYENLKLKAKVSKLEAEKNKLSNRMQMAEAELAEIEKLIRDNLKSLNQ